MFEWIRLLRSGSVPRCCSLVKEAVQRDRLFKSNGCPRFSSLTKPRRRQCLYSGLPYIRLSHAFLGLAQPRHFFQRTPRDWQSIIDDINVHENWHRGSSVDKLYCFKEAYKLDSDTNVLPFGCHLQDIFSNHLAKRLCQSPQWTKQCTYERKYA